MAAIKGRTFARGLCSICFREMQVRVSGIPKQHSPLPGDGICPGSQQPAIPVSEEMAAELRLARDEAQKAYDREYYQRTKERYAEARRGARRPYMQKRRELLNRMKLERGCTDCGFNAHAVALDFDHVGEKSADISQLYARSLVRLMAEIAKCEVVCANCHRIRTASRAGWSSSSLEDHVA